MATTRLDTPVSYRELARTIATIEADERPKVIFLGASSMWGGGGVASYEQALPAQVSAFLATGTVAYNLSFPAARPLDLFLLLYRLQGQANLFVVDISTAHLNAAYAQGVTADRTKYLRVQNLLTTQAKKFTQDQPRAQACLQSNNIPVSQEFFVDFSPYIPVIRYADAINRSLFGKHFSLFFSDFLGRAMDVPRSGLNKNHWAGLLATPRDIPPAPGVTSTPLTAPLIPLQPSVNSCISEQMAAFVTAQKMPVVFYFSPHSQVLTESYRQNGSYASTTAWIRARYGQAVVLDPDSTPVLRPGDFYDETHFYPSGHQRLAHWLVEQLRTGEYRALFR